MGRKKGSKNKPKTLIETTDISIQETSKKRGRPKKEPREPFKLSDDVIIGVDLASEPDMTAHVEPPREPKEIKKNEDLQTNQDSTSNESEDTELSSTDKESQESATMASGRKRKVAQSSAKKANYPLCDCCKREIYCQPHRIDTNILTAQVADYYRESPRWVELCGECAKKLSDVVDIWLRENGCLTKFEIKAMEQNEDKENSGEYIPDEEFLKQSEGSESSEDDW